ncbi:hypothetical protein HYW21_05435 [Candidatus Woesearchaeota archaeon]|nr:hypothetical protein [Candidatus Woesearchaeota archaeon]
MGFKAAPLSGSFMLIAMFGFIISAFFTAYGTISPSFGFSFSLVFLLMFIASIISMEYGPTDVELEMDKKLWRFAQRKDAKVLEKFLSPKAKRVLAKKRALRG